MKNEKRKKISMRSGDITLEEAFLEFISEKKAENMRDMTIVYYYNNWQFFKQFLDIKGIQDFESITPTLINEYINYHRERNPEIKDTSINTYITAVKVILYYFMEKEYLYHFKIKKIKAKKEVKEPYTDDELIKLLTKPDIKTCSFAEYRNWVLACHLSATGIRLNTLINIKIRDIDFNYNIILLRELKNNKPYEVPIDKDYLPILKEYLKIRNGEPEDYLFCNHYGKQFTPDGLKTVVRKYNLSRGVEKTSIHLYRHTFAKAWILTNGNSKKLQNALGHSTPAMVDEYLSIYGREFEADYEKHTPFSKIKDEIKPKKRIRIRTKD